MMKLEEPDKGQAWIVAIAASLMCMILGGLSRGGGLLYVAIIATYGVSRKDAAQPFFFKDAIRCLAGPIVGVIGQTFGVKATTFWGGVVASLGVTLCYIARNVFWLTVFWGGLYGFGLALANTLFYVVINQYFVKYRATASGIAVAGSSVGSFVLPVLTEVVLDAFGLSGGFLILGGITMHTLPLSLLLKSPQWIENPEQYDLLKTLKMKQQTSKILEKSLSESPPEEGEKNGGTMPMEKFYANSMPTISGELEKKKSNIDSMVYCEKKLEVSSAKKTSLLQNIRGIGTLYTNPVFVLISVCMAIFTCIIAPILTVVVDYGKDKGISESYGIYLINSIGVGDLIGKLCFGWVTDKKFLSVPVCIATAFIMKGGFILLFPLATDLYSYMLLLALYGSTIGTVISHFPLLILRYVDINLQSVAMGCEAFLSGIALFALPSIVGYFRDDVGSYDGMFYLMGTMAVVSGCFWFLIPSLVEFQHKKDEPNNILQEKTKMKTEFEEQKRTGMIPNMNEQKLNPQKSNTE